MQDELEVLNESVKDVRSCIDQRIDHEDLAMLEQFLKSTKQKKFWLSLITASSGDRCYPDEGMRWSGWFGALTDHQLPTPPILALLREAGLFGTHWDERARRLVWESRGWT